MSFNINGPFNNYQKNPYPNPPIHQGGQNPSKTTAIFQSATSQMKTPEPAKPSGNAGNFGDRFIPQSFPSMNAFSGTAFMPFDVNQFVPISQAVFTGPKCPSAAQCPLNPPATKK